MIRAVTFDFWDTLVHDDSDEPKRRARGLPTKAAAREALFVNAVATAHPGRRAVDVTDAWAGAGRWCAARWLGDRVTPTLADRLGHALSSLGGLELADRAALIDALADVELDPLPDVVAGAREALDALSGRYALGIVSDATFTPGRSLGRILAAHGLDGYFAFSAFSDEVGHAKPAAGIFEAACAGLGVRADALVHVGDKEAHDVVGAHAVGARCVLFTGAVDRRGPDSRADAFAGDLRELPALLGRL